MDFILELIFDLIVDGSIGAVGDKKVPMIVRVLACAFLIIVFGGIVALCVFIGIIEKQYWIIAIGLFIALVVGLAVWKAFKQHKNK